MYNLSKTPNYWRENMRIHKITDLIEEAHEILNAMSIFEVIDLDRPAARKILTEIHNSPESEEIEHYLDVVEDLRLVTG